MSRDSPDGPRFGRNFPPFGAFDKAEPSPPGALERANWDDWSQRRRDECDIAHFDPFGGGRALYLPESAAAGASEPSHAPLARCDVCSRERDRRVWDPGDNGGGPCGS